MAKKKVKLKKRIRVLVCLVFIAILGVLGFFYFRNTWMSEKKNDLEKEDLKKEEKKPQEYSAKIFMVGDALIHWGVYNDAKQSDGSYDFKPMLEAIKPISSKYDLAYYNQETVLGGASLGYSSYPRFNSPQEVGDAFIDAGFNMVSLATNHTMDKGEVGVINSVEYWKKQSGVAASGQWTSAEERESSIAKVNLE